MKTIKDYLDSLFLHVPTTPETKKAKEDLYSIMEDHYYELIDEGKSENEAIGAVISEFGSIDELLAELDLDKEETVEEEEFAEDVELEEADDFWADNRSFAFSLAGGVLCLCLAAASMGLIDTSFGTFSILLFFLFGAIGVGFIVSASIKFSRSLKNLSNRLLTRAVLSEAAEQTLAYEKSFRIGLVVGIGFCILAIPLTVLFADYGGSLGATAFFGTAGIGVFLILYVSLIYNGFKRLTYNNKRDKQRLDRSYNRRSQEEEEDFRITAFKRLYWPCIVILYFIGSAVTSSWSFSWLLFIIAGPLYRVIIDWLRHQEDKY